MNVVQIKQAELRIAPFASGCLHSSDNLTDILAHQATLKLANFRVSVGKNKSITAAEIKQNEIKVDWESKQRLIFTP